ncbi:hypothetical protein QBC33DRAFT_31366 [Phialemonium atrogriseum]|uniref:Uncharacterized protein n=1 Tax=Phialemonium atrogriseum TaxID=1093897 RepID=A0AAJ0FU73_9PEZI|nr:uncharacterized protein QBC33DRAFT_31366 [Phialemonium atrogriseum]KAK1772845.1 hypothetical protein QBC33DRAFT_31366 [Phialemonium atrogriseum]
MGFPRHPACVWCQTTQSCQELEPLSVNFTWRRFSGRETLLPQALLWSWRLLWLHCRSKLPYSQRIFEGFNIARSRWQKIVEGITNSTFHSSSVTGGPRSFIEALYYHVNINVVLRPEFAPCVIPTTVGKWPVKPIRSLIFRPTANPGNRTRASPRLTVLRSFVSWFLGALGSDVDTSKKYNRLYHPKSPSPSMTKALSIAQSLGIGGESLDLDDTMHTEDHGDDSIYGSRKCWRLPRAASLPPANGCIGGRLPSPPTASIYCGCILSIPFFVHDLDKCGIMEYATSALRLAVNRHWISLDIIGSHRWTKRCEWPSWNARARQGERPSQAPLSPYPLQMEDGLGNFTAAFAGSFWVA